MTRKKTYGVWRAECQKAADDHSALSLGDIWEGDPYDLEEAALDAWEAGQSAPSFIEGAFAEDIASHEYDERLLEESLQYGDPPEDE